MPLYVINEKIMNLKVDAIALPYCKEIKNYYETNYYDSKSLYEIYETVVNDGKAIDLSEEKNKLKEKLEKIKKKGLSIENSYLEYIETYKGRKSLTEKTKKIKNDLQVLEKFNLFSSGFKKRDIILHKTNINKSNIYNFYEDIINFAVNQKLSKIAIPIVDFHNMPDRNYYISMAKNFARSAIKEAKKDITVYLILTDTNNDYCQDSKPENIYEKIAYFLNKQNLDKNEIEKRAKKEFEKLKKYYPESHDVIVWEKNRRIYSKDDYLKFYYDKLLIKQNPRSNGAKYDLFGNIIDEAEYKNLTYWDEDAYWERINYAMKVLGYQFSLNISDIPKYKRNNKNILKKLGTDLKFYIKREEELEAYRKAQKEITFCKRLPSKSENIQDEIQSLIDSKEETFSQMVLRIIKKTHRDKIACYKAANVNKNIFSKIVKDANGDENEDGTPYVYKPDKKIVFAFAIALRLKKKEAEELLKKAGYAFTHYPQDIIVQKCIEKEIYDIDIVNQFLFRFNQPLLGTTIRD